MSNLWSTYAPKLQEWSHAHPRPLPWKGIRDPYRIWLSEVLLQQTRVEQGLPYFERFVRAYPTIADLAAAPQEDIYKLWEGLGYYARARNMHAAAKSVMEEHNGTFPATYEAIRTLKGVGDYTAAAIASFAYDLPHAVLDGNVYRVLSRWFGIGTPIDSTEGKQEFSRLAEAILDKNNPAAHNQAMMDFGATWCTPKNPHCARCPFQDQCVAWQEGRVAELPVKAKKLVKKERFFAYIVVRKGDSTFLQQRLEKDIWQNLWTFPALEPEELPTTLGEARALLPPEWNEIPIVSLSKPFKQTLTHRLVQVVFVVVDWHESLTPFLTNTQPVSWAKAAPELPVPRIVEWYWNERNQLFIA